MRVLNELIFLVIVMVFVLSYQNIPPMPSMARSIGVRSYPKYGAAKCMSPELYNNVTATAPRMMVPPGNAPRSPHIAHISAAATIANLDRIHHAALAYFMSWCTVVELLALLGIIRDLTMLLLL